jgi:hypothetical protein
VSQAQLFHVPADRGATFSTCGRYRYRLWRRGNRSGARLLWIMLNPSVANADADDPTIRKCLGFADRWNFGRVDVVNLCALISTDPRALRKAEDPFGPENDVAIFAAAEGATMIVGAWGGPLPRRLRGRSPEVQRLLAGRPVHCLSRTAGGEPRHPLMLAYSTPLEVLWNA